MSESRPYRYLEVEAYAGLVNVASNLQHVEPDEDGERYLEVRLQLLGDYVKINWGDPSYDTDHRGYWGAGLMHETDSELDTRELANDLVNQALDHRAEASE